MKNTSKLAAVAGLACVASAAFAAPPRVIFSEITTSPTSSVPGLGTALFQSFDRPYVSADGTNWILSADTDLATTNDEVIIVGSGLTGGVVVQEGVTVLDGKLAGLLDRNMGINGAGDFVFATNTDGDTNTDEYVFKYDSGLDAFVVVAREGDDVPGVFDEFFGITLDSTGMLDDGTPVFRASSTVGLLGTTEDDFLFSGTSIVAQTGNTIPAGQAFGFTETWDVFDLNDFYITPSGATSVIQGDLTGATTGDDVVVVNGTVVIQEGQPLETGGLPVALVSETLASGESWFSRGDYSDDIDWLVKDGVIVAETGDPVPGGLPGEFLDQTLFSSTFFLMAANSNGDYVYGATTSNSDPEADAVIVLNNTTVVLRQGDPVDLDGNGLADDNAFIDIFNNDDAFLTDDGRYYFTADLYDSALVSLGQAFMVIQLDLGGGCPADLTGSSDPNDPSYGIGDGDADGDDFFFYLDAFSSSNLAVCDLTGSSDPNDPSFGNPDGDCDGDDFFFYL
ncbi:MAG: GC-type dockerin domain-anchored protein, partial [Phycisphaerales bacterium JB037]